MDSSTNLPKVSVLVTTYNHAPFVRESLNSLTAQSFRDFEIVITDDASTDGTAELIQQWLDETCTTAYFFRNQVNRGICANRNSALSIASGEFLCSLSGDDAYEPERIARQLECFTHQPPDVAVVYSDMRMVDARGRDLGISFLAYALGKEPAPESGVFDRLLHGCFMPAPAAMIRRSCLNDVGPYDETLSYEDYDMWLRLSALFPFCFLPGYLVRYRILATSMSHSPRFRRSKLESTLRLLQRWQINGDPQLCWTIARRQIQLHLDLEGLRELEQAAQRLGWKHRLLARCMRIPGACAAARAVYRILYVSTALRMKWYLMRAGCRAFIARTVHSTAFPL
jgi:glycosyltransferase involved in cell wall biosynthesis